MKHLIDLDEQALANARLALGTTTIKATVNEALRRAAMDSDREIRIRSSLDFLASMSNVEREDAWR
jgi:Arc/MetJ family transcription regulator